MGKKRCLYAVVLVYSVILAVGCFRVVKAGEVIEEMQQEMGEELDYHMRQLAQRQAEKEGGSWEERYVAQKEEQNAHIEIIKEFFKLRPETMREELKKLPEYVED